MYENVPICGECWINDALTKPERCLFDGDVPVGVLLPVRIVVPESALEICGLCDNKTRLGAYMKMRSDDPKLLRNKAVPMSHLADEVEIGRAHV